MSVIDIILIKLNEIGYFGWYRTRCPSEIFDEVSWNLIIKDKYEKF